MAYPNPYGNPPGYYPPNTGPPGFSAPAAPGLPYAPPNAPASLPHMQPSFPAHIDPRAQVIHFTNQHHGNQQSEGAGAPRRESGKRGLGYQQASDGHKQHTRENELLKEPAQNEVARTIVIEIPPGLDDLKMDMILRSVSGLRRSIPVTEVNGKSVGYILAEFSDVEGLAAAATVLPDIPVPVKEKKGTKEMSIKDEVAIKDGPNNDEASNDDVAVEEPNRYPLKVFISNETDAYIDQWTRKISSAVLEDRTAATKRSVDQVLYGLASDTQEYGGGPNGLVMQETFDPLTGATLTIPLEKDEEELDNVPDEQREKVAAEITAFRERSLKRDVDRQKREEEAQKRDFKTPPTGPAHGLNGVPVGPRGSAPNAPRLLQTQQNSGNPTSIGYPARSNWMAVVGDDISDKELERWRLAKKKQDEEKVNEDAMKNRKEHERLIKNTRVRKSKLKKTEEETRSKHLAAMLEELQNSKTDEDSRLHTREKLRYSGDWALKFNPAVHKEEEMDEVDRKAEEKEIDEAVRKAEEKENEIATANRMLLDQPMPDAARYDERPPPLANKKVNPFSFGNKPAKPKARSAMSMGAELEDETAAALETRHVHKKKMLPQLDETALMTDAEREAERKKILANVTHDIDALFNTPVDWDNITEDAIQGPITGRVQSLINAHQPDGSAAFLVPHVVRRIMARQTAQNVMSLIAEGFHRRDAEDIVVGLWRFILYTAEIKRRNLVDEE